MKEPGLTSCCFLNGEGNILKYDILKKEVSTLLSQRFAKILGQKH